MVIARDYPVAAAIDGYLACQNRSPIPAGPAVIDHHDGRAERVEGLALIEPEARSVPMRARRTHIAWRPHEVWALIEAARDMFDRPDTPFSARSTWLSAWYARSDARPVAVWVGEDGEPVGLALLAIQRSGPVRRIVLCGHGPSDYGRLPLRDAEAAGELAQGIVEVLARLRGPWRLVLAQLPVGDPVAKALTQTLAGARIEAAQPSPRLLFGDDRRVERVLSGATRREGRRGHNRLTAAGVTVEIRRIADPAGVRTALPQVIAVHRARDRAVGRRSDLDSPARRAFFADALAGLADEGRLDVWLILLDGAIGAYFVGARDGGSYRIVDGRMSGSWPTASPALILRIELTTQLLADPAIVEIDYLRGIQPHKTQDATDIVPAETLVAESSRRLRWAVEHADRLRRTLRERLTPATLRRIQSVRLRLAVRDADHRVQRRP